MAWIHFLQLVTTPDIITLPSLINAALLACRCYLKPLQRHPAKKHTRRFLQHSILAHPQLNTKRENLQTSCHDSHGPCHLNETAVTKPFCFCQQHDSQLIC